MAAADPPSLDVPGQGRDGPTQMPAEQAPIPVSQEELNSWRRGFTPQAEIWNGRLAMLGLSVGIGVLLLVRLVSASNP